MTLSESNDYTITPGPCATYSNGVLTLPPSRSEVAFTIMSVDNGYNEGDKNLTIKTGTRTLPDGWGIDAERDNFTLEITGD